MMIMKNFDEFHKTINNICSKKDVYKKTKLHPPHILINCENEFEKEYILNHIVDSFRNSGIINFDFSINPYLYYAFDGSLQQLKNVFFGIALNSGFSNHYEYILALDVSKLLPLTNEIQGKEFFEKICEVQKHATCIFFVPNSKTAGVERFVAKLGDICSPIIKVNIEQYSYHDLACIISEKIKNDFSIECEYNLEHYLEELFKKSCINNPDKALEVMENLLLCTDFSQAPPKLDHKAFENKGKEGVKQ